MKTRRGFVSNSSSTSFCIYGIRKSEEDLDYLKKKFDIDCIDDLDDINILPKGLTFFTGQYGDSYYIGRSWCNIGDDETGRQFKDNIRTNLEKFFGESNLDLDTFEEAWYDG